MLTGLKLRAALLLPAISLLAACSLDPQPEPPMMEDGTGGMFGDAAASNGGSGGSAGSSIGKGGSAGAAGAAGSSGVLDASADAPCTGDNCFCEGVDGGCEAACDANCEGGCDDADASDDASDAGEPADGALDDDALGGETGP